MLLIALVSYINSLYELNDHKQLQITTMKLKEIFEIATSMHKLNLNFNFD